MRGAIVEGSTQETGQVTGTKDKDYNLIWFTEQCLSNALRLQTYIQDAERDGDSELAEFFKRARATRIPATHAESRLRRPPCAGARSECDLACSHRSYIRPHQSWNPPLHSTGRTNDPRSRPRSDDKLLASGRHRPLPPNPHQWPWRRTGCGTH